MNTLEILTNMLIFIVPALLSILTVTAATWVLRRLSVAYDDHLWNMSASLGLLPWATHLPALYLPKAQSWSCHSSLYNLQYLLVMNSFKKILIWKCCRKERLSTSLFLKKSSMPPVLLSPFYSKFLYPRTQLVSCLFFLAHTSRCF